jgi:hypothetical protein
MKVEPPFVKKNPPPPEAVYGPEQFRICRQACNVRVKTMHMYLSVLFRIWKLCMIANSRCKDCAMYIRNHKLIL